MASTKTTSKSPAHAEAASRLKERRSPWPMVSVDDALTMVLQQTPTSAPMQVSLQEALGCVLADDITAPEPLPPFPAAIMDGYAVCSCDGPGVFPVMGRLTAGVDPDAHGLILAPGYTCYITTGTKLPQGADAVVKIEDTAPPEGGTREGGREKRKRRRLPSAF
ncbi:molybdopterin biosynthesis protein cnx1 [Nannochloropsis gaditana]|uniref:Molybdopterin biosynthesis protein cnx1 n=1 Tax=Nannochloropsis gaditana TaxID=72520 RepID=W7TIZ7_9STRA|nr:molybdopterin biosynthesis protein cnx1 [Nannochloropsis gaditana]